MALAPQKQGMARFHAGGLFQPAYIPGPDDKLQKELAPGYCQSAPKPPFVNGSEGPMFGRPVINVPSPRPQPAHGFSAPYVTSGPDHGFGAPPQTGLQSNAVCYNKKTVY